MAPLGMFCPFLNDGCKRELCRMWWKKGEDCMVALELEDQMTFQEEAAEAGKSGLLRISKDLSKALNRVALGNLLRSGSVSDEDKALITKLHEDLEKKADVLVLERLMR